ncbi:MAG: RND transporter family protein [Myxococcales bacterium]
MLCGLYGRGISIDSGALDALPDDVPAVRAWLDTLRRFDALDSWLVGLEEPGAGLSLEGLRRVDAVTRSLEALRADGVLAVRSVTNVQTLREGADGAVDSSLLVAALPADAADLGALRQRLLGDPEVLGALVSRDLRGYALVVRVDPRKDAGKVARLVERTVEAARGPLKARYLGAPFFAAAPVKRLAARLPWIAPLFLLLLLGIFAAGTRQPGRSVLVLGAAAASLVWCVALERLLGRSLSPSSATLALGWFAVAGATFAALGEPRAEGLPRRWPSLARVALCLAGAVAGGFLLAHARVRCTPQELFSTHDEVGKALAFFDERFGGSDVLQVDFAGDLTDPAVAARLLRLSDLLEGTRGLSDVRSVAQILAFLNHGFGDSFRIPSAPAALANLWFFLEGNGDARNLVSDRRDEALVVIRVPSRPAQSLAALVGSVNAAIAASAAQGPAATAERLAAIARASGTALDPARVAAVIEAATREPPKAEEVAIDAEVSSQLREILSSPDSPYRPSEGEWARLAVVLAQGPFDLRNRLTQAIASMEGLRAADQGARFAGMLAQREHDLRLAARSRRLAAQLAGSPEAFLPRAQGAIADLLDPQEDAGRAAAVTTAVSGLPVVAGAIASNALANLWRKLALIFGLGLLLWPALGVPEGARRLLAAATATALTVIVCRAVGVDLDVGSAGAYLLPAVLGVATPVERRGPRSFLLGLGAALLTLLLAGSPPVTRLAAAAAAGLASTALVAWFLGARPPANC